MDGGEDIPSHSMPDGSPAPLRGMEYAVANTAIEWTEKTWNPVTGCTKVSPGCKHCYAETLTRRLTAMGQAKYANGFSLTVHDDSLAEPLRWNSRSLSS